MGNWFSERGRVMKSPLVSWWSGISVLYMQSLCRSQDGMKMPRMRLRKPFWSHCVVSTNAGVPIVSGDG